MDNVGLIRGFGGVLGRKLGSLKQKAEEQAVALGGKALSTARETRTKLGKTGDQVLETLQDKSKFARQLASRFTTDNPLRKQVSELKAQLKQAKTTAQYESVAKDTLQLVGHAQGDVDNTHLLKQLGNASQVLGAAMEDQELPRNLDFSGGLQHQLDQVQISQEELATLKRAERDMEELQKLQEDLEGLRDIAQMLKGQMNNQGEVLDRIEFHIEDGLAKVAEGTEQLENARETDSKNLKLKIAISVALTVLAIIALLIILL